MGRYDDILTKDLLDDMYNVQLMSTVDIGTKFNIDRTTITNYMKKYGIERRDCSTSGAMKSIKFGNIDEAFFETIDTEQKAYILGFIMGDGYLSPNGVSITLAIEDSQILKDIAKCIGAEDAIKIVKTKNVKWQDKIHLHIRRMKMVRDVHTAGIPFPPKSSYESLVIMSNNRLQWDFIRGIFDSDGCVRCYERDGKVKYTFRITSSEKLCTELKLFIEQEFNISLPPKCVRKCVGCYSLDICSESMIKLIFSKMYDNSTIFLNRKREIFYRMFLPKPSCPNCNTELINVKFYTKCPNINCVYKVHH
jgi:hypothetical protein